MSEKERAAALLEAEDDAFCERLYQDYLKDPERGNLVSFADALKECGVSPLYGESGGTVRLHVGSA